MNVPISGVGQERGDEPLEIAGVNILSGGADDARSGPCAGPCGCWRRGERGTGRPATPISALEGYNSAGNVFLSKMDMRLRYSRGETARVAELIDDRTATEGKLERSRSRRQDR